MKIKTPNLVALAVIVFTAAVSFDQMSFVSSGQTNPPLPPVSDAAPSPATVATGQVVTLGWDYPELLLPGITFRIYTATNLSLALTNWDLTASVDAPALQVAVVITAPQQFFFATASNGFGESVPSPVGAYPPLAPSGLRIGN